MYLLRNSFNIIRIKNSFNLLYAPSRKIISSTKNLSKKEDIIESANNYDFTINTNKFNLPVPIKPTIFQKFKQQLGFQGSLRHPQGALAYASLRLYLCIQYQIDYDRFFKLCESPDVMYSFCLVTFLHVWLLSVPLFQHGQTGLFVRRELYRVMWKDIETRERKLKAPMNRKNKLVTYTHLNDIFRAFLFGFDEGILSDDTVLAGAIWRHLLEMKELNDFAVLGILCDYIRKNVAHLEKINELDLLKNGIASFVDFDQQEVDHLAPRNCGRYFQKKEWVIIIISSILTLGVSASTIFILITSLLNQPDSNISTVVIILFNCVFLVYYIINGLVNLKGYDLYIGYITTFSIILLVCFYEFFYFYNQDDLNTVELIRLLLCVSLYPLSIYIVMKIASEISWIEFKILGASEAFQGIYRQSGYFTAMIKFDTQLSILVFLIYHDGKGYMQSCFSKLAIGFGTPTTILIAFIGYVAMRNESQKKMILFFFGLLLIPAYIIYQIYIILEFITESKLDLYMNCLFLAFGISCIITKCMLIVEIFYVKKNFHQGLIERAFLVEKNSEAQHLLLKNKRRNLNQIL